MRFLVLSLLIAAATVAQAQAPPESACTYQVCALRVEPGFFGIRIVQGEEGDVVSAAGLFSGVDLAEAVAGSPAAMEHAERYYASRRRSGLAYGGAVVLALLGSYAETEGQTGLAMVGYAAGFAATIYGTSQLASAQRERDRAIWDYNAQFAD